MTEREVFEQWHSRQYICSDPLEWDGDGYADFDHSRAWKAWQASRRAALEEIATILMDQSIPHLAVRMNDAMKLIDKTVSPE